MKTDDDAFVRVDELHASLKNLNITRGLLYGRINFESEPHRDVDSKWYITPEVHAILCLDLSICTSFLLKQENELSSSQCITGEEI